MFRRLFIQLFVPRKYRWLTDEVAHLSGGESAQMKVFAGDLQKGMQLLEVPPHLRITAVVSRLKGER